MYVMCLSRGLNAINEWKREFEPQKPVAFIPNAGDTYQDPYFVRESQQRLELLGLTTKLLDLRHLKSRSDFEERLSECSAVFVAGGNSFYLLGQLYASGTLDSLRQLVRSGFPYFGESAGAVILYRTIEPVAMIDDPQDAPGLESTDALGIVDFITLPHVDREKYQTLFDAFFSQYSGTHRIVKIRDDQALLTRDGSTIVLLRSDIADLG